MPFISAFFNNGFSNQDFPSSLVLQANDGFRFKPATRVENACATGSAAIHQGLNFLEAKQGKVVLVVGVEKMTETAGPEIGGILMKASYLKRIRKLKEGSLASSDRSHSNTSKSMATRPMPSPGSRQRIIRMAFPTRWRSCARILDTNSAAMCPKRSDCCRSIEATDCSLVSDGAAAVVLTDMETALTMKKAVVFRARSHVNDYLPMGRRDMSHLDGCARAWANALSDGKLQLEDLSMVETHDCFTMAELMEYEAMGLTKPGEGARALKGVGRRRTVSFRSTRRAALNQRPSDRRDRRFHACACCDAAPRRGG